MELVLARDKVKNEDKIYKNGPVYVKNDELRVYIDEDKENELGSLYYKELGRDITKWLKEKGIDEVTLDFDNLFEFGNAPGIIRSEDTIIDFLLGLHIGKISAKDYNNDLDVYGVNVDNDFNTNYIKPLFTFDTKKYFKQTIAILDYVRYMTKALSFVIKTINTPHNLLSMKDIRLKIFDLFKGVYNIEIAIYDDYYLRKNDYNLIRAVSKASKSKPYMMHLSYRPPRPNRKCLTHKVLVGKGVHYDSGGIYIKPHDTMLNMKYDKTGALTAIAVLYVAAKLNLNVKLDVVVGFAENMVSNKGYKPGDVLKAKNGKTIEVVHTDAEGRLVLADCLQYVDEVIEDYNNVITLATLTGAARRALGEYTAAVHSTNYYQAIGITHSGKTTSEYHNYMYPHPKLKNSIKSKIADIRNIANTDLAGSITAFWFLTNFIKKPDNLVHIDLAGVAWTEKGFGYVDYGATGFGIRALVGYLEESGKCPDELKDY